MRYAVEIKGDYVFPPLTWGDEARHDWHSPRDRPDLWTFDDFDVASDMAFRLEGYSYWSPAFEDGSMKWAIRAIRA